MGAFCLDQFIYFDKCARCHIVVDVEFDINLNLAEIMTSTVEIKDDARGRPIQKAKVSLLYKDSSFTSLF